MDTEMVELLKRMIRMDAEKNDLGLMERDLESWILDDKMSYSKLTGSEST